MDELHFKSQIGNRKPEISNLNRRHFLKLALAAAAVSTPGFHAKASPSNPDRASGLIDVNVNLGRWPFRRLGCDETPALVRMLKRQGVTQAWAGSFDGLLQKNLGAVNARIAGECRRYGPGLLMPIGSINPKLPDWEEEFRRCAEEHRMPGIRLHPNYHGYSLSDPGLSALLRLATARGLFIQLAALMEDERMMHPLMRVPAVDLAPLPHLVREIPRLRLILLNALGGIRPDALRPIVEAAEVYFEISMLEGIGGVARILQDLPVNRILFGSHSPLFYFESATLKLRESPLTADQLKRIRSYNARELLSGHEHK